ncbi:MAG: hypothetical protein ACYDAR_09340 [Thermomicrobiales bacterium]
MTRHDAAGHDQGAKTGTLKRRGLIAGAAALAAAMLADRKTERVAADDGVWSLPYTGTALTTGNFGVAVSVSCAVDGSTGIYGFGKYVGIHGAGATGLWGEGAVGKGGSTAGVGVVGTANSDTAIHGIAQTGTGVYGETGGVYGMYGISSAPGGVGVSGNCTGGYGVLGTVSDGYAVFGQAVTGNGVRGYSQQNHAIVGQTGRAYYGGVFGVATLADTVGIYGSTFNGTSNVADAYAGYMDGNFVCVHGV